jgi:spermidine synthase
MLGHLPALLHSHPRTALVIGLGSGITVGGLAQYDLERIDVVEIEPAVIQAASFFEKENRNVLHNPKVKIITADARNFLLVNREKYDLIISEPSNPWIGGVASLFTVESFNLARDHLNPGGIMVQWFHGYSMRPDDLRMVAASFRWVFPNATLWTGTPSDYFLVGGMQPVVVDMERVRSVYRNNPVLREDMQKIKMLLPETILSDFYLDEDDLGRLVVGAELNTDDRLPLEFSAPRGLYETTEGLNLQMLRQSKKSKYPDLSGVSQEELERLPVQYDLALSFIEKGLLVEAMEHLKAVLAKDPQFVPALIQSGRIKMQSARSLEAMEDFLAALKSDPRSSEAHYQLGLLYLMQNKTEVGIQSIQKAVAIDPDNQTYHLELATDFKNAKRYDEAADEYRSVLALGATLIMRKKAADAVVVLEQAIVIDPKDHRLYFQLGQAYLLLKQMEEARRVFEMAIRLEPGDADPYLGLGKAWIALGEHRKAIVNFKKATDINPGIAIPEI